MPGPLGERHVLRDGAIPPDEQMRRYLDAANFRKIGVRIEVELVAKQCLDFIAPEMPRWQADAMQYDQVRFDTCRSRVPVGARTESRRRQQPRVSIDGKFLRQAQFSSGMISKP